MPMRTAPSCSPGSRTHSCSLVYFRSSGYTVSPRGSGRLTAVRLLLGGLLRRPGIGVLEPPGLDDRLDVDADPLVDLYGGALVLELVARTLREVHGALEGVGVADHVDDVRRPDHLPVDGDAADGVLERGLGDDPHLVVELDGLRAGGAQLLDHVDHR